MRASHGAGRKDTHPRHSRENFSEKMQKNTSQSSLWTTARVASGFSGLTLMVVLLAWWLNLIPDRSYNILEERKSIAESLAVAYADLMQINKPDQTDPIIRDMMSRSPQLLSIAVKDPKGKLVLEIGDHMANWVVRSDGLSTDSQIKIPIIQRTSTHGDVILGDLELRFMPIYPSGASYILRNDIIRLLLFVSAVGFLSYSGFIWYILRAVMSATTSDAIPKRIRASLNTLAEGVMILDKRQHVVLANDAFARLVGRTTKDVEGNPIAGFSWVKPKDNPSASYPWDQASTTGQPNTGFLLGLNTGRLTASLSVNSTPILGVDGTNRGTMVTFDNITKIEKKNRQLRRLLDRIARSRAKIQEQNKELEFFANHDPMTKCFNRRAFFAQFENQWGSSKRYNYPLSCIMFDIDHFKRINDTYGHGVGDQVIKHVATLMETSKRANDVVGRLGGEEFVILLPHVDVEEAMMAAERLRRLVESTPVNNIRFTASMGVSSTLLGAPDTTTMLNQSDEALYASKHTGRNRVSRFDRMPTVDKDAKEKDAKEREAGHAYKPPPAPDAAAPAAAAPAAPAAAAPVAPTAATPIAAKPAVAKPAAAAPAAAKPAVAAKPVISKPAGAKPAVAAKPVISKAAVAAPAAAAIPAPAAAIPAPALPTPASAAPATAAPAAASDDIDDASVSAPADIDTASANAH
jgi:diguanylate cyclase (GGDEF)-like protein/PAS domain S-box-containing protein